MQEADATFVCALYFIESVVGGEGVIPDTMGLGYKAVSNSLRDRDKGRYGGTAVLDMHCDELAANRVGFVHDLLICLVEIYDHEFIATVTCDKCLIIGNRIDNSGNRLDDLITHLMSVCIIEFLEKVDVEHLHAEGGLHGKGLLEHLF